jgi:hypothetical protein
MDPLQEPGIAYWAIADDMMMRGCIDIGIAIIKIISKRITKPEYDKLDQDTYQRYEQVSFITGVFKQEVRKGTGIFGLTGPDTIFKTIEPG